MAGTSHGTGPEAQKGSVIVWCRKQRDVFGDWDRLPLWIVFSDEFDDLVMTEGPARSEMSMSIHYKSKANE